MRICLGFWGLLRSFDITQQSIQENILSVFEEANIECDVYFHTYYNLPCKNYGERTNDNKKNPLLIDLFVKNFKPKDFRSDDKEIVENEIDVTKYRTKGCAWNSKDFYLTNNVVLAQYSKFKVLQLIEESGTYYDYVIFLRPDAFFLEKFDLSFLENVTNTQIVTASHQVHGIGKFKINDRFFLCNSKTYKIIGNIFLSLYEISLKKALHSESIIAEYLHDNGIANFKHNIPFVLVRVNGKTYEKDYLQQFINNSENDTKKTKLRKLL